MNERHQAMARLYVEEGLTYGQIAKRYKITRQRVGQILGPLEVAKHHGARRQAEKLKELQAAHARIMARESTLAQEAERLGYTWAKNLRARLRLLGLKIKLEQVEPEHGTTLRYRRGCKCDECRRANREQNEQLRTRREAPNHGTESGYRNYGCHCSRCTTAARIAARERRAQKRKKKEVME